jgi:hypothetical protein
MSIAANALDEGRALEVLGRMAAASRGEAGS